MRTPPGQLADITRRLLATSFELRTGSGAPIFWQDMHHNLRRQRTPRLLSASFEIFLDDGPLLPTFRSVNNVRRV